ncbi:hypothetical protein ES705_25700 [subsurface metagenome]
MTKAPISPTPTNGVTKYPVYSQAEAFLKNFLGRGRGWYIKTKLHAEYRYSASLDVIVRRLAPHIFEVRAYPPGDLFFASPEEGLAIEEFRGWIFVNDPRTRSLTYVTGTMREGVELYKLARIAIRHKRTLNQASQLYRTLLPGR